MKEWRGPDRDGDEHGMRREFGFWLAVIGAATIGAVAAKLI